MKTLHDKYMTDEVTGYCTGLTFDEWVDDLVEKGLALACCKTGVLFYISHEQKHKVKPDDPCLCKEYLEVMEKYSKAEIKDWGIDALIGLQLTINSQQFNTGQTIYD